MNNEINHNPEPAQEMPLVDVGKNDQDQTDQQKREARIRQIDQELAEFSAKAQTEDEIKSVQMERDQEYQNKIQELETGLGQPLSEETKAMIHQNMVDGAIEQARKNNERFNNLHRLRKAAEVLSPVDFLYFEKILGNHEGRIDGLFNPAGKALHTTNDFYFDKMLDSGVIRTGEKKDGMYRTKGASFTDGNASEALTFQTIFDDQNSRSAEKRFNSQYYGDKARDFVDFFWSTKRQKTREYLEKKSGQTVATIKDAIRIAEGFKHKTSPEELENNPKQLSELFGITIVYDKEKLPELTSEGTEGIQTDFELRSYRAGGVSLSEASVVFAPESQIANIQEKLARRGLTHIDVRSSEELEAARLVDIIDRGESKHERDQAREQTIADYVARNNLEEKLKEFQIDPLSRECKVSIVIPSYGEGSKVVDAIKTLLNQVDRSDNPVPIDDFEVIVVINQRANSTVEEIDDNQKSIEAIQRLLTQSAAEGKGIKNVHFIFKEFTPEEGGVGAARRLGSDLVVLRDHRRTQDSGRYSPLYIAGTDADTKADQHWVADIVSDSEHTDSAAYGGELIFDDELEKELPQSASARLRALYQDVRNKYVRAVGSGLQGSNFVLRKDIIAHMDGLSVLQRGEDIENDQKLKSLGEEVAMLDDKHITSSRRLITGMYGAINGEYFVPPREGENPNDRMLSSDEIDERIAHRKTAMASYLIDNLKPEIANNHEIRELLGESAEDLTRLTPEELKQTLRDVRPDKNGKIRNIEARNKLIRDIVLQMSGEIFDNKLPLTAKEIAIFGIKKEK